MPQIQLEQQVRFGSSTSFVYISTSKSSYLFILLLILLLLVLLLLLLLLLLVLLLLLLLHLTSTFNSLTLVSQSRQTLLVDSNRITVLSVISLFFITLLLFSFIGESKEFVL